MNSNKIYRLLTDIRLTIVLLSVAALCFVLDTVFDGLDLIHSVPMYLLAALFAVNLTLCTVGRLRWAMEKSDGKLKVAAWGSPILHVGLIVIMAGSFLSWLVGRETYYEIPVGETAQVAGASGTIDMTIDDFRVDYYEDDVSARQYTTDMTLTKRDGASKKAQAFVNGGVRFDGVSIIQQAYGWNSKVTLSTSKASRTIDVKDEEWIPMSADENGKRLGLTFYPDYREDDKSMAKKSLKDDNPRLLWVVTEFGKPVAMDVLKVGEEATVGEGVRVKFDGYAYYTGLQAKYDPGVRVIFAGFLLFLVGLTIRYGSMVARSMTEGAQATTDAPAAKKE